MSDSDSGAEKRSKKAEKKQKAKARRVSSSSSDEGVNDPMPVKKAKTEAGSSGGPKDPEGNEMIELGKMKYATVKEFKGKTFVDIREYYLDKGSGTVKPGKKGIALSVEQFGQLKKVLPEIDARLKNAS